jgi:hypothetical protein
MEELAVLSAIIKSVYARFCKLEAVLNSELKPNRSSGRRGGGPRLPAPSWEEQRAACADAHASVAVAYGHMNRADSAGPVSAAAFSLPPQHGGEPPCPESTGPAGSAPAAKKAHLSATEGPAAADPAPTEFASTAEKEAAPQRSLPRRALWVRELHGGELGEEAEDEEYVPPATSSDSSSESSEYSDGEDSIKPEEVAALLADAKVPISVLEIMIMVAESAPFHHEQLAACPETLATVAAWPATRATFKSSATEPAAPLTGEQQVDQQVGRPLAGGTKGESSSDSEPVHGDKLRSRLRQLRSESEGSAEAARSLSEAQVDKPTEPALPVGGAVRATEETLPEDAPPPWLCLYEPAAAGTVSSAVAGHSRPPRGPPEPSVWFVEGAEPPSDNAWKKQRKLAEKAARKATKVKAKADEAASLAALASKEPTASSSLPKPVLLAGREVPTYAADYTFADHNKRRAAEQDQATAADRPDKEQVDRQRLLAQGQRLLAAATRSKATSLTTRPLWPPAANEDYVERLLARHGLVRPAPRNTTLPPPATFPLPPADSSDSSSAC